MSEDSGKEFVSEMIAMDRAWLAGTFDQWLENKRKEVIDGIRNEGTLEREVPEVMDANKVGP